MLRSMLLLLLRLLPSEVDLQGTNMPDLAGIEESDVVVVGCTAVCLHLTDASSAVPLLMACRMWNNCYCSRIMHRTAHLSLKLVTP
jgi:hypothetical protein